MIFLFLRFNESLNQPTLSVMAFISKIYIKEVKKKMTEAKPGGLQQTVRTTDGRHQCTLRTRI